MKNYSFEELQPYLIGKGSERFCFRNPNNPACVIKLSPQDKSKQTLREIKYYRFLQRKNIPFLYLPEFKGEVSVPGYIGFEQEAIFDDNGEISKPMSHYSGRDFDIELKKNIWLLFANLFYYMHYYNILPCDLTLNNIVINLKKGLPRLVLIDGIGSANFLTISQYCAPLGHLQIKRKWTRFAKRDLEDWLNLKEHLESAKH